MMSYRLRHRDYMAGGGLRPINRKTTGRINFPSPSKQKEVRYFHTLEHKKRRMLIEQLKEVNSKILFPDNFYMAINNFIENKPFVLDDVTKEYLLNLTKGKLPSIWPLELYFFLRDHMRPKIYNETLKFITNKGNESTEWVKYLEYKAPENIRPILNLWKKSKNRR